MESDAVLRSRQFRDALYEALAGAETAVRDAGPLLVLARLTERAAPPAANDEAAAATVDALSAVAAESQIEAALALAEARFETPERFREALYFARCLSRDAGAGLALLQARRYLEEALVPASFRDLSTDRQAVLDATTFASLWAEAGRLGWLLDTTGIWRREYAGVYTGRHTAFNASLSGLSERVDALAQQAAALERLNGLRRLGPPLAVAAVAHFHDLERLFACTVEAERLAEALATAPTCPECAFRLGDEAPSADARRVRQAIERGLAGQQTRLAQRVVSRLLARPIHTGEERLARFIQVVQASDVSGLALVLDDALVDFLRDLLESPAPSDGVLDRLARSFPEVTPANIEAAVSEFRRLVEAEVSRGGRLRLRRQDDDV